MGTPQSGEYDSSQWRAAARAETSLETTLHYWPGRWSRAVVHAALAIEPLATALTPQAWTDLLDGLSMLVDDSLRDRSAFP